MVKKENFELDELEFYVLEDLANKIWLEKVTHDIFKNYPLYLIRQFRENEEDREKLLKLIREIKRKKVKDKLLDFYSHCEEYL
jgi:hypothetical protein